MTVFHIPKSGLQPSELHVKRLEAELSYWRDKSQSLAKILEGIPQALELNGSVTLFYPNNKSVKLYRDPPNKVSPSWPLTTTGPFNFPWHNGPRVTFNEYGLNHPPGSVAALKISDAAIAPIVGEDIQNTTLRCSN